MEEEVLYETKSGEGLAELKRKAENELEAEYQEKVKNEIKGRLRKIAKCRESLDFEVDDLDRFIVAPESKREFRFSDYYVSSSSGSSDGKIQTYTLA